MKYPPGASLAFPAGWLGVRLGLPDRKSKKHTDCGAPFGKACVVRVSESATKTTVHVTACMLAAVRAVAVCIIVMSVVFIS